MRLLLGAFVVVVAVSCLEPVADQDGGTGGGKSSDAGATGGGSTGGGIGGGSTGGGIGGGSTGGGIGGGSNGGGVGGGSVDGGLSCGELVNAYQAAMQTAKTCSLMLPVVQCTAVRDEFLGCAGCTVSVQQTAELDRLRAQFNNQNCPPTTCGVFCGHPDGGTCQSFGALSAGRCVP